MRFRPTRTARSTVAGLKRRFRHRANVRLKPIDSPELIALVAGWLSQKENSQWLDFGDGRQTLTPEWLKIMTQRDRHLLRLFSPHQAYTPNGPVALRRVY